MDVDFFPFRKSKIFQSLRKCARVELGVELVGRPVQLVQTDRWFSKLLGEGDDSFL